MRITHRLLIVVLAAFLLSTTLAHAESPEFSTVIGTVNSHDARCANTHLISRMWKSVQVEGARKHRSHSLQNRRESAIRLHITVVFMCR